MRHAPEYDFVVTPGADPGQIRMQFDGAPIFVWTAAIWCSQRPTEQNSVTRTEGPKRVSAQCSRRLAFESRARNLEDSLMLKRIVLCFDGTWNTPSDRADLDAVHPQHSSQDDNQLDKVDPAAGVETNVCRLFRSVLSGNKCASGGDDLFQIKWYDKGVGTDWWDRVPGGAFGLGLSRKIREGYKKLSDSYDDGDHVFVFGFNRGAYAKPSRFHPQLRLASKRISNKGRSRRKRCADGSV